MQTLISVIHLPYNNRLFLTHSLGINDANDHRGISAVFGTEQRVLVQTSSIQPPSPGMLAFVPHSGVMPTVQQPQQQQQPQPQQQQAHAAVKPSSTHQSSQPARNPSGGVVTQQPGDTVAPSNKRSSSRKPSSSSSSSSTSASCSAFKCC